MGCSRGSSHPYVFPSCINHAWPNRRSTVVQAYLGFESLGVLFGRPTFSPSLIPKYDRDFHLRPRDCRVRKSDSTLVLMGRSIVFARGKTYCRRHWVECGSQQYWVESWMFRRIVGGDVVTILVCTSMTSQAPTRDHARKLLARLRGTGDWFRDGAPMVEFRTDQAFDTCYDDRGAPRFS